MLRELSLKAKRRAREKSSTVAAPPSTDPKLKDEPPKPRGLAGLPRRLSRGPSSFHRRNSSQLSARSGDSADTKDERKESSVTSIIRAARRSSGGSSSWRSRKSERVSDTPSTSRVFSKKPGVTSPLLSVDELFKWRPSGAAAKCVSSVPLSDSATKRFVRSAPASRQLPPTSAARGACGSLKRLQPPRLLLCHDFKDGYPDWEATATGVIGDECPPDSKMWRFNHWAYVDIFVYFSHYCVTIPPVGYIHAAHRHGALVLGTLIFEREPGLTELQKILASFKTRAKAANQLAAIAKFYGFDGWLVNVEVALPGGSSAASDLAAFVGDLTRSTRRIVGQTSEVIWYDSVTRDGSLNWQNELNADNEQFFKAAGSIFTNYHWDRNAPVRSAVKAGTRRTDVFTGVDVHGRKTFGGGGFHTHIALRAIKQGGTSAAIFAPGWTVEKCPPNIPDPRELEERFWTGPSGRFGRECISQYFRERPVITELPFETNFDPGWGPHNMRHGVMQDDRRYFNMAQQQIQPSFLRANCAGGDGNAATMCLTHDKAYNGSASIMTQFAFSESRMLTGSYSVLRLFVASTVFPTRFSSRLVKSKEGSIQLSYDYYATGEADGAQAAGDNFGMVLLFASPPVAILLVGKGSTWTRAGDGSRRPQREQIHGKFVNFETIVATSERRAFGAPAPDDGSTGWMTRTFTLDGAMTSGQRLAEVMLIVGGPPQQPVSVRPSPFLSPLASRGISRYGSRSGSRVGSRYGSRSGSRSNSPPPEREDHEESDMRHRYRGLATVPEDGIIDPNRSGRGDDDFGSGLLQQYRESFGVQNRGDFPRGLRRTSDHGQLRRPLSNGFERRQESAPGVFHRYLDGDNQNYDAYGDAQGRGLHQRGSGRPYSSYSNNFQVEGRLDFGEMEQENGMLSVSTSRALSRLGSRLQSPMGSRLGSQYGSRYGSLAGSRLNSMAGSLAGSRTGSVAGSLAASRSASRHGSRFASPSRTPATGGGGAVALGSLSRDLSERLPGAAQGIEDGTATPRSSAALNDLKTRLMHAAGSMAGEAGGIGKKRTVYLGGFRMELLQMEASRPPV